MEKLEIIQFCVNNNTPEFNFNKALEETTEFNEALLKLQTKHKDNPKRPDRREILKEYGDMVYRGLIAVLTLYKDIDPDDVDDLISEHIEYKLGKLKDYKNEGKYKGGL